MRLIYVARLRRNRRRYQQASQVKTGETIETAFGLSLGRPATPTRLCRRFARTPGLGSALAGIVLLALSACWDMVCPGRSTTPFR
jgi:hypothetical protein